ALARPGQRRLAGAGCARSARAPLRRGGGGAAGGGADRLVRGGGPPGASRTPPGKLRSAWSAAAPRAAAPPSVDGVAKGAVAETAGLLHSLGHEVAARDPHGGGLAK